MIYNSAGAKHDTKIHYGKGSILVKAFTDIINQAPHQKSRYDFQKSFFIKQMHILCCFCRKQNKTAYHKKYRYAKTRSGIDCIGKPPCFCSKNSCIGKILCIAVQQYHRKYGQYSDDFQIQYFFFFFHIHSFIYINIFMIVIAAKHCPLQQCCF